MKSINSIKKIFMVMLLFTAGMFMNKANAQVEYPNYTVTSVTPSNNAEVRSISKIIVSFNDSEYDAPLAMMPKAAQTTVSGATGSHIITQKVEGGKLTVSFNPAISNEGKVKINIPAGITNNLAMPVATMTPEELIEEGYCTNPAIELNYDVKPVSIKIQDVTNQYGKSLLNDAKLTCNSGEQFGDGDMVTHIYIKFNEELNSAVASGQINNYVTITNTTTGKKYGLNAFSSGIKTIGGKDNTIIDLFLSSDSYINSDSHQGVYEVKILPGLASTSDGMKTEGIEFSFTYGDPEKAVIPSDINLDEYVGKYAVTTEEGEIVEGVDKFSVIKDETNTYYATGFNNTELLIPIILKDGEFYFQKTSKGEYSFMDLKGTDVLVEFAINQGKYCIFLDQCALFYPGAGDDLYRLHGLQWYVKEDPTTGIQNITTETSSALFNLAGQRVNGAKNKGIVVMDGKKFIVK